MRKSQKSHGARSIRQMEEDTDSICCDKVLDKGRPEGWCIVMMPKNLPHSCLWTLFCLEVYTSGSPFKQKYFPVTYLPSGIEIWATTPCPSKKMVYKTFFMLHLSFLFLRVVEVHPCFISNSYLFQTHFVAVLILTNKYLATSTLSFFWCWLRIWGTHLAQSFLIWRCSCKMWCELLPLRCPLVLLHLSM